MQRWADHLEVPIQDIIAWEAEFRRRYTRYDPVNHVPGFRNRALQAQDIRGTIREVMAGVTLRISGGLARAITNVYEAAMGLNRAHLVDGNARRRRDGRRRESDVLHYHSVNAMEVSRNVRPRPFNGIRSTHPRNGV